MNEIKEKSFRGPVKAIIFDWAGTTVDFGCMAPTGVFIEVFRQKGIDITVAEARGPMGLHKRDHIRIIGSYPRVAQLWEEKYGRSINEDDINQMFESFIPLQMEVIKNHAEIVPELPAALEIAKMKGLKIGSTTGYNNEMMEILTRAAAEQGYIPDSWVCATDVPAGRPAPWMAFKNAEKLGVYPMHSIIKIGDTIADIDEGLNAGMWSVGVIKSSNEMGLTLNELQALDTHELQQRTIEIRQKYFDAGAHFVIDNLSELEELIDQINEKLALGEVPR
jgi:phosphonoacetaldehyde hydrolase